MSRAHFVYALTLSILVLAISWKQQHNPALTHRVSGVEVPRYTPGVALAISLSAKYLEAACGENGKFIYQRSVYSGDMSTSYNVVRHAGAIYSLGMLNAGHPNPEIVGTMLRAAEFMRTVYMGQDTRSRTLAVWSNPKPKQSQATLGGAGLGLAALAAVDRARPNAVPLEELEAVGRFILFLQRSDGSFVSKYDSTYGLIEGSKSLYYPGEAAVGLISLYELDHDPRWLTAAGKALAYLARNRAGVSPIPADHWALIATARLLPYCREPECVKSQLVGHAVHICNRILQDQIQIGSDRRLEGGFDVAGRTTPTATRLEGLLAALEFLPSDNSGERLAIEGAVKRGIAFLLRSEITAGPYAGGMPGAVLDSNNPHAANIRIDYVQHALSAWLRYQSMFGER